MGATLDLSGMWETHAGTEQRPRVPLPHPTTESGILSPLSQDEGPHPEVSFLLFTVLMHLSVLLKLQHFLSGSSRHSMLFHFALLFPGSVFSA